jgi:hypothetical protein
MPRRRHSAALVVLLAALVAAPSPAAAGVAPRWPGVEAYYRSLLDCTRSGGWVEADGTCDTVDADQRVPKRPALQRTRVLSRDVARPHARRMARAGVLSHDLGGSIRERFARAGAADGRIGENLGYASGDPKDAVLRIHRLFQDEWSYDGWHWRNMTDGRFREVGIGVWVKDGRTWLAVAFHD